MLGLKLREEFKGRRLKGTAIELTNKNNTGATQIPAGDFLRITYPSSDVLKMLEAAGPERGQPIVLKGERGQGKSHLMAVLYHCLTDHAAAEAWLNYWADRLSYDQLYRDALSDPELKRTREELEAAISNANEARKVVFELFQDLDRFSLDDYKPFADIDAGKSRIEAFMSASLAADGARLVPDKDGCLRIEVPDADNPARFTFDRDRVQADERLELLGLDHPLVSEMLRRWKSQPPEQLGVAVDGASEHLPETKIDGACLWLDSKNPVVALSLRFDRIDWFWFTLMHELGHIDAGDGRYDAIPPDIDLVGMDSNRTSDKPDFERAADSFASSFLVPDAHLSNFIARVRPLYSKKKIEGFAAVQQIHPGLVVGQLQYRKEISYANLRAYLVKVRVHLLETVLSDGWGVTPPTGN